MLKPFGAALLQAFGMSITAAPALARQTVVTQVDKDFDESMTSQLAVTTDQDETLASGEAKAIVDFVTVCNLYGLVDGSIHSRAGWEFSPEDFGRIRAANGFPTRLLVDDPNTPNLTWAVTKPVVKGAQLDSFTATSRVAGMVRGECSAQVTRQLPAVKGATGTPDVAGNISKQALIGALPTPSFLVEVK